VVFTVWLILQSLGIQHCGNLLRVTDTLEEFNASLCKVAEEVKVSGRIV
jgi:hypothetical protein